MIPPLLPSLLQSLFPSKATPLCPDAKPPPFSVRKFAVSTSATRSPSFKLTSGSKSASGSAKGYTSASGSESATTGPGLGIRIRTRLSLGNGNDNGSTSCATSVRVGLLRTPNALAGSKVTSAPSPKSLPVSSTRSSPPPPFERLSSERDALLRFSVVVSEASKFPCPSTIILLKAPKDSLQNRHLELGEDYFCNCNGHVDDGTSHSSSVVSISYRSWEILLYTW
ncbi:hypothetical protein BJV77DRAFT_161452 [Russula vinacea]|nr:hypothetical protein BJV77DRAFT_161452 [Russula vinacea]